MVLVQLDLPVEIAKALDTYVLEMKYKHPKRHYSRKMFVGEAVDSYLKLQKGLFYKQIAERRTKLKGRP